MPTHKKQRSGKSSSRLSERSTAKAMEGIASKKRLKEFFLSHPTLLPLIVLSLVGVLLYMNSIHNEFVFDDIPLILQNRMIQSFKNIPTLLGITTGRPFYRPIREVSYLIDYQFTGLNPVGYHLFNIFYHILSSYIVFLIASRLSKNRKVAWITAFLFIAHPIQTESVAYISGRRDILTALFFFMGYYFFLKFRESPSRKDLLFIFLSYILSLSSKEMGVTLPAVFLLHDLITPFSRDAETEKSSHPLTKFLSRLKQILKTYWRFYLGFFLIALLFTFYKVFIRNPSHQEGFYGGTMASNFLTVLRIWVFYIKLLILPLSLNAAHSFPLSKSLFELRTILAIFILLGLFTLLITLLKNKSRYSFCGFWFFITLLPVSQIFPHHELLAEHYLYLPSFGFFLAIGLLSLDLLQRERWRPFVYGSLMAILLLYSYQTISRNFDWKNELTLWTNAAKKSPDNLRAKINLIAAYNSNGQYDLAIAESRELLKTAPQNHELYNKLGVSYMLKGELDQAVEIFKTSIQIKKGNPIAYNDLGVLYLEKKEFEQAIEAFRQAIATRPQYAEAHNNLAKALALKGLLEEAIQEEKEAIRTDPLTADYRFNLARLYENKGFTNEAIFEYQKALKLEPKFFEAHYHLGALYTKIENHHEAIRELENALKINPQSGKSYFLLGVNFIRTRNKEKAISSLEKALQYATNEKDRTGIESVLSRLRLLPG